MANVYVHASQARVYADTPDAQSTTGSLCTPVPQRRAQGGCNFQCCADTGTIGTPIGTATGDAFLVENPEAHLVCYSTTRSRYRDLVTTNSQFASKELIVGNGQSLCVPSTKRPADRLPDLTIELPIETNPNGDTAGCALAVEWHVSENAGVAVTVPFKVFMRTDEGHSASIIIPSLPANGVTLGLATLGPPGINCYDPDCFVEGVVDINDDVSESDETNNTDSRNDPG